MKANAMKLIRLKTVLDRTGLSRSVLYDLMGKGAFPKPTKIYLGARANVWPEQEVDAFIESRVTDRGNTAPHLVEQVRNMLAAKGSVAP